MKTITMFILLAITNQWEFKKDYGLEVYQLETSEILQFLDKMYEHAVMEIKKGTPADFMKEVRRYFGDFFIFF